MVPPVPKDASPHAEAGDYHYRRDVAMEAVYEDDRPSRSKRRGSRKQTDWATLLLRSLQLDVLSCPKCSGRMRVLACITEPQTIRKMLTSMGLSCDIPVRAPPREPPQGEFEFVQ